MEKDPARVFSVSVNLCGHPKESEVVFENQKYRWDDYGHNSIVKTGFRLNNKTEKHSTIGSGGGMKTKWREKKISRKKKRDCSSDIGGAFFLVSAADSGKPADSKRTGRSGGDVCQRRKKEENKEEKRKKRRSAGAGTGQYRSKSVSDN